MHSELETLIHNLEKEAYSSVLRAFRAQSDAITWEKQGLITELRKELRVSDDEHRELLSHVNADDIICKIREWGQTGRHQTALLGTSQALHYPISNPTMSASHKKQKVGHSVPSLSTGVYSSALHSQSLAAPMQPRFSAGTRGTALGPRGRMRKPYPRGPTARFSRGLSGSTAANDHIESAASDPLIGRKVMTRWPEDNNFYEAVITDYNPLEGRHALVYDVNTVNETWEWVNLKEMPPEDIRWEGEDPGLSRIGGQSGRRGHGQEKFLNLDGIVSGAGSGRESQRALPPAQNGNMKKVPDEIEIRNTNMLIKEVEKIFGANHSDLNEIEKAKSMLKEHEQALVDLIDRLADASDGESEEGQLI